MAVGKEIRTQISSISSTRKITSAMEMVAASKMRRAQETMSRGKPYAQRIRTLVAHLAAGNSECHHAYFSERTVKNIGFIVVSTDRGLCGGLNVNLFKRAIREMAAWKEKKANISLCLIGTKAASFFNSVGGNVVASTKNLGEKPKLADLIGTVKTLLDKFEEGTLDKILLLSNEFISTMNQNPEANQLLPLVADPSDDLKHHWDYIYEPDDAKVLLSGLLKRYIESLVYQAVVENTACEQAARMIAMKNATENAGDLIKDLQLIYNKERQAAITQELSEIVSGAAAV